MGGITESWRLEKTSNIIKSSLRPNPTVPNKAYHKVLCLLSFWTPAGLGGSLGSPWQCFTTLYMKEFFLISSLNVAWTAWDQAPGSARVNWHYSDCGGSREPSTEQGSEMGQGGWAEPGAGGNIHPAAMQTGYHEPQVHAARISSSFSEAWELLIVCTNTHSYGCSWSAQPWQAVQLYLITWTKANPLVCSSSGCQMRSWMDLRRLMQQQCGAKTSCKQQRSFPCDHQIPWSQVWAQEWFLSLV